MSFLSDLKYLCQPRKILLRIFRFDFSVDSHDSYILRYTFNFNWQKFREVTNTLKNVPVKLDRKPEQPQINAFMLLGWESLL